MNTRSSEESALHFITPHCDALSGIMAAERPITTDEACALRLLLFGNMMNSFNVAWIEQSFHFRSVPPYGFLQKRSGPCGVLAAVQSYVICELLFGTAKLGDASEMFTLKSGKKRQALAHAVTTILWQAGDDEKAIVAVKCNRVVLTPDILEPDGILECLRLKYFECKSCLAEYFLNSAPEMMTDNNANCIYFLYSLILTHGIQKIKEEMDYSESNLIGDDGYCSQEVINLILTGKAVTNLFDGDVELNSGGSETTLHRGIPRRPKIGLLTLHEYEENCSVGDNYKTPIYPIWVMHAENHFTVLFSTSKSILRKRFKDSFVLYHYDGLAKRYAEISYTIDPNADSSTPPKDKTIPVALKCIYTRWPHASVEMNEEINSD